MRLCAGTEQILVLLQRHYHDDVLPHLRHAIMVGACVTVVRALSHAVSHSTTRNVRMLRCACFSLARRRDESARVGDVA
jgi:hypothetical protein